MVQVITYTCFFLKIGARTALKKIIPRVEGGGVSKLTLSFSPDFISTSKSKDLLKFFLVLFRPISLFFRGVLDVRSHLGGSPF